MFMTKFLRYQVSIQFIYHAVAKNENILFRIMTTNSINLVDFYFIYSVTTLFNVGHTIVTRLIKTNLTKTN